MGRKPIREIVGARGILTGSGVTFDVVFDLLELGDPDELSAKRYSYGRLKFLHALEPPMEKLLLSSSRLTLRGGGIEVSIFLHGSKSFGIVGPVREVNRKSVAA